MFKKLSFERALYHSIIYTIFTYFLFTTFVGDSTIDLRNFGIFLLIFLLLYLFGKYFDNIKNKVYGNIKMLAKYDIYEKVKTMNLYTMSILLLTAFALMLRLYELGNAHFWYDEVLTVGAAESFVAGEGFSEPGGTEYWRSWLTVTLPISASFFVFGVSEFSARLPSVLIGTALVPLSYLVGRQLDSRHLGLLFASFITLDYWVLMHSRQARMYIHLQFLFLLTVYLFYKWYRNDFKFINEWAVLLGLIGLLGYITHRAYTSIGIVILLFVFLNLIYLIFKTSVSDGNVGQKLIMRNVAIVGVLIFGLMMYMYFRGLPTLLANEAPAWYNSAFGDGRPDGFYFDLMTDRSPFPKELAAILFVSGIIYMLTKKSVGVLYVISFLLPFTILSNVFFQMPRYIFYLYPLFLLICLFPISKFIEHIHTNLADEKRNTKYQRQKLTVVMIAVIFISTQIFVPASGALFFLTDKSHGYDERPDHQTPSVYISDIKDARDGVSLNAPDNAPEFLFSASTDSPATVISTSPRTTLWYNGYLNYTTYPLGQIEEKNGQEYHVRSDVPILTNEQEAKDIVDEGHGWIFIDYREDHANQSVINTLKDNSVPVYQGREEITTLRYYGPEINNSNSVN